MTTDATVMRDEPEQAVKRALHLVRVLFTLAGEQYVRNNVTGFMDIGPPMKIPRADTDLFK